jgi:hypothetical protein
MVGLSNEELEQECGCEITAEHCCPENHLPEQLRILKLAALDPNIKPNWEFFSIWLANESDVASGEAEEIGELMNLSSVKIHFCPFCGTAIEKESAAG